MMWTSSVLHLRRLTGCKKIKVSHHGDQLDETEVETMTQTEHEASYAQVRAVTGAGPRPEADPSQEQLASSMLR